MGWWKDNIDIVKQLDPAARSTLEVILTYPGLKALAAHRLSHFCGSMALSCWLECIASFGVFGHRLRSIRELGLIQVFSLIMELAW